MSHHMKVLEPVLAPLIGPVAKRLLGHEVHRKYRCACGGEIQESGGRVTMSSKKEIEHHTRCRNCGKVKKVKLSKAHSKKLVMALATPAGARMVGPMAMRMGGKGFLSSVLKSGAQLAADLAKKHAGNLIQKGSEYLAQKAEERGHAGIGSLIRTGGNAASQYAHAKFGTAGSGVRRHRRMHGMGTRAGAAHSPWVALVRANPNVPFKTLSMRYKKSGMSHAVHHSRARSHKMHGSGTRAGAAHNPWAQLVRANPGVPFKTLAMRYRKGHAIPRHIVHRPRGGSLSAAGLHRRRLHGRGVLEDVHIPSGGTSLAKYGYNPAASVAHRKAALKKAKSALGELLAQEALYDFSQAIQNPELREVAENDYSDFDSLVGGSLSGAGSRRHKRMHGRGVLEDVHIPSGGTSLAKYGYNPAAPVAKRIMALKKAKAALGELLAQEALYDFSQAIQDPALQQVAEDDYSNFDSLAGGSIHRRAHHSNRVMRGGSGRKGGAHVLSAKAEKGRMSYQAWLKTVPTGVYSAEEKSILWNDYASKRNPAHKPSKAFQHILAHGEGLLRHLRSEIARKSGHRQAYNRGRHQRAHGKVTFMPGHGLFEA